MTEELFVEKLDDITCMICLEVPAGKIVLLQAFFELYEGVGTVRTLDARSSLVCVLTSVSMLHECLEVLDATRDRVAWRPVPPLSEVERERYLGYGKRQKAQSAQRQLH